MPFRPQRSCPRRCWVGVDAGIVWAVARRQRVTAESTEQHRGQNCIRLCGSPCPPRSIPSGFMARSRIAAAGARKTLLSNSCCRKHLGCGFTRPSKKPRSNVDGLLQFCKLVAHAKCCGSPVGEVQHLVGRCISLFCWDSPDFTTGRGFFASIVYRCPVAAGKAWGPGDRDGTRRRNRRRGSV